MRGLEHLGQRILAQLGAGFQALLADRLEDALNDGIVIHRPGFSGIRIAIFAGGLHTLVFTEVAQKLEAI